MNEMLKHFFGDGEVCDHAFLERADGGDVARRAAQHGLGFGADRRDALGAAGSAILPDCHDRRLVEDYALTAHVDQGVCGAQING